jgi:riboflavin kinase / FMN adenylyltransferase
VSYYLTKVVKGKGRGKTIGFPTLNLTVPENFEYDHGIYAGWVQMGNAKHMGAFHYGPVPAFDDLGVTLEVFVIEAEIPKAPKEVSFEIIKLLRKIKNFESLKKLSVQIKKDVLETKKILDGDQK